MNSNEIKTMLSTDNDVICRKYVFNNKTAFSCLGAGRVVYLKKFISNLPSTEQCFIDRDLLTKQYFEQCNMFICKRTIIEAYFDWFLRYAITFTSKELMKSPRIIGYISEYVFGSWLKLHAYNIKYVKVKEYDKAVNKVLFWF